MSATIPPRPLLPFLRPGSRRGRWKRVPFLSRFGIDTPIDSPRAKGFPGSSAGRLMEGAIRLTCSTRRSWVQGDQFTKPAQPFNLAGYRCFQRDLVTQLPVKVKTKVRDRPTWILNTPKGVYLRQRATGDIWAKLYEFPAHRNGLSLLNWLLSAFRP